jgi:hypothetical protein
MRARPLFAALRIGAARASSGALFWVSAALALLIVLFCAVESLLIARSSAADTLVRMPAACSSALVWGAGVLVAFAAAVRALRRDREEGIVALLASRGVGRSYFAGRVGGLAIVLAALSCGGTLVCGLVAALAANRLGVAARVLAATGGAVFYGALASITLATVAFAALGARSRPGGYVRLLMVLALPDLVARLLRDVVAEDWRELFSIPDALAAVRGALMPGDLDPFRFARALVVVVLVVGIAVAFARRELALASDPEAEPAEARR